MTLSNTVSNFNSAKVSISVGKECPTQVIIPIIIGQPIKIQEITRNRAKAASKGKKQLIVMNEDLYKAITPIKSTVKRGKASKASSPDQSMHLMSKHSKSKLNQHLKASRSKYQLDYTQKKPNITTTVRKDKNTRWNEDLVPYLHAMATPSKQACQSTFMT